MSVSVTNSLSIRLFYNHYSSVASGSTRKNSTTGTLSFADATALRNAIRNLQDYKFEDVTKDQIQEKLKAFTDTMNNTLESAAKYGKGNSSVKHAASTIKNLNTQYASDLAKIGITVNKDGSMSLYENAAKNYSVSKFSEFFDKDSQYLSDLYSAANRITRRVDVRI